MTNPFEGTTDPAALFALVQDGVECPECEEGCGYIVVLLGPQYGDGAEGPVEQECPTCHGTGKVSLSDEQQDQVLMRAFEVMKPELRDRILELLEGKSQRP